MSHIFCHDIAAWCCRSTEHDEQGYHFFACKGEVGSNRQKDCTLHKETDKRGCESRLDPSAGCFDLKACTKCDQGKRCCHDRQIGNRLCHKEWQLDLGNRSQQTKQNT